MEIMEQLVDLQCSQWPGVIVKGAAQSAVCFRPMFTSGLGCGLAAIKPYERTNVASGSIEKAIMDAY